MYNYAQREKENLILKKKNQQTQFLVIIFSTSCFSLLIIIAFVVLIDIHKNKIMRLKMEKLTLFKNKMEKDKYNKTMIEQKHTALMSAEI